MKLGSIILTAALTMVAAQVAMAQETATDEKASKPVASVAETGADSDKPKTMSGMSILGNEEAPKALVIIPWKSSELGDDISLSDTLDDRARPVDKEVFLRELSFYAIRAGDKQL